MTKLYGQIDSSITRAELCRVLGSAGANSALRASSHYTGGEYVRLESNVATMTFEPVSAGEMLVQGDADDHAALRALAWSAVRALRQAGLRHRLEVHGDDGRIWAYFHHDWPIRRVWIGHLSADATRAARVADIARSAGAAVTLRSFDRFPIADSLAALLADVGSRHDAAVCFLREDDGREVWVARESAVLSQRNAVDVSVYRATDEHLTRLDGARIDVARENGEALAIVRDALPWAHVDHRRLLVAHDTFVIRNRGLVLAPDVPLHRLPGSWQQKTRVGVCAPRGQARAFDALVAIPFVSPLNLERNLAYTITLSGASSEEVPSGSEVWFAEAAG